MFWELLWFLLPVAAATGWYARSRAERARNPQSRLPQGGAEYYQGLNYLLNEQPDKAIEVFLGVLEADSEAVETHTALGNLFRRRGEVDRAIRIHQNLVARPTLTREQRSLALLELGQDYMRAGLFDRAENLFQEIVEGELYAEPALKQLLVIYQQEKEWERAIATAKMLETVSGRPMGSFIAQFCCEMAEQVRALGERSDAISWLKKAQAADRYCVRATLLKGDMQAEAQDHAAAIRTYQRVEFQDAELISEVIGPLSRCYASLAAAGQFRAFLEGLLERHPSTAPALALAALIGEQEGEERARQFLSAHLTQRPSVRGLERLVALSVDATSGQESKALLTLREAIAKLMGDRPAYRCKHCGFTGNTLHWLCPSCKHWSTIRPIQDPVYG